MVVCERGAVKTSMREPRGVIPKSHFPKSYFL
jgi:hypothetical protein